jgi:type IV secretory pathway VirB6-like protein
METLIEDYKTKDPTSATDGYGNPNYYKRMNQEIEMTCFNVTSPDVAYKPITNNSHANGHEENVQVVTTPNYLLLVGGLESHTTHLIKKPLSIWRLRVSSDLIQQQNCM